MENLTWNTSQNPPSARLLAISMSLVRWAVAGVGLISAGLFAVSAAGTHSMEDALKALATLLATVVILTLLRRGQFAAPEHDSSTTRGMFIGSVIGMAVPAIIVYIVIHDIF